MLVTIFVELLRLVVGFMRVAMSDGDIEQDEHSHVGLEKLRKCGVVFTQAAFAAGAVTGPRARDRGSRGVWSGADGGSEQQKPADGFGDAQLRCAARLIVCVLMMEGGLVLMSRKRM